MNCFYFSISKSMDKYLKLFDVGGEATHFIGQIVLNLTIIERKRLVSGPSNSISRTQILIGLSLFILRSI